MGNGVQGTKTNNSLSVNICGKEYVVDRDWGCLKQQGISDVISDVVVLSDGRVCALFRHEPSIRVFSPEGEMIDSWGGYPIVDGHGLNRDGDGFFVVDRDGQEVLRLTNDGDVDFRIGTRNTPRWEEPLNHPTAAIRGNDGSIFVADGYGNAQVHRFTAHGEYVQSFGKLGVEAGEFLNPHALALHSDGRLVVVDRDNHRLQLFNDSGDFSEIWNGFWRPMGVTTMPDGVVLVSDQSPALHAISSDGTRIGRCRAADDWPHGVSCSDDMTVFLAEMHPTSITKLQPLF